MKQIIQKWNSISLIVRIAVGLIIGAVLGVLAPQATAVAILGNIFVGALKAIAPILVFVLIISALANAGGNIGSRFRTVICLYMGTTLLASLAAVIASYLFPVTLTLGDAVTQDAPSGIWEVLGTLITNMVQNPVTSIMNANYIGVLTWAIIFGLGFKTVASESTRQVLVDISEVVSTAVRWIISLAPFGILGLVYSSVSTSGLGIFADYGKLLAVLVGCMLFVALVINPLLVFLLLRRNPYPLFEGERHHGLLHQKLGSQHSRQHAAV